MIYIQAKVKKSSNLLWIASFHKIALVTVMGSNYDVPTHNTFSTIQTHCEQQQFKYLNWWLSYLFCVRAIFSFILEYVCMCVCVMLGCYVQAPFKNTTRINSFCICLQFCAVFHLFYNLHVCVIKATRHKNVTPSFPSARAKWCEQFEISLFFLLSLCAFFFFFTFW